MSWELSQLLASVLEDEDLSERATEIIEQAVNALTWAPLDAPVEPTWDGEGSILPDPDAARIGRYEDLGLLGRGAMGEVRRVRDPDLNRVLAMKTVSPAFLGNRGLVARFVREAQATAQLQHPGIVPVHELGRLDDGRLYYTMREVKGRSLRNVLEVVHWGREHDWTLRRRIDLLHFVCDAVGYAHARGVVHRDLKPENVMVGHYGDVLVVDWGLVKILGGETESGESVEAARPTGELDSGDHATRMGAIAGTPAYMAPEQARGELEAIGPASDVFALGVILGEILGAEGPEAARRGDLPGTADPDLSAICARALREVADERYPSAGAMGEALGAWLEGAKRRERAMALVQQAAELRPEAEALRRQAEADRQRALEGLEEVPTDAPVSEKLEFWRLEDGAADKLRDALVRETEAIQRLQAALGQAPDLAEAHRALAESYRREHRDAEARRDELAAARAEVFLRAHDDGRYADYLAGYGSFSLQTDPPGATVRVFRYETRDRLLVLEPMGELGTTPVHEARLPAGSYLLELEAPGRHLVRYPVRIWRATHWRATPPGGGEDLPVPLPVAGTLREDECYVAPGWFFSGGDPKSFRKLDGRYVWVDGFAIQRDAVTCGQYIEFLNDLEQRGQTELALRCAPRERASGGLEIPGRTPDGRWFLRPDTDGFEWFDEMPVVCIDWPSGRAYARWWSERTGLRWDLPWAAQTEKATRGVDGRSFAMGDHLDATWANTRRSRRGDPGPVAVGTNPVDVSPYGVRDLCGNASHWCLDVWRPEAIQPDGERLGPELQPVPEAVNRVLRGGSWGYDPDACRSAYHIGQIEKSGNGMTGIRLARWVVADDVG